MIHSPSSNVPAQQEAGSDFAADQYPGQQERRQALSAVIARIRQSLDLDTIFATTVTEVRKLLQADRVGVFRFHPEADWEGEFVWEDVGQEWLSALTERVRDHCFSEHFADLYRQGRINTIDDINEGHRQSCYLSILKRFQVQANIVVPLLKGDSLWGLICIHQCSGPRHWLETDIEFASQIAAHLGVALQHADLLAQAQAQIEQQKALASVIARIRQSLDLETTFQTTVKEVRHLLQADRIGVFRFYPQMDWQGEFVSEDVAPSWNSVLGETIEDYCFKQQFAELYRQGRISAVSDVRSQGEQQDCYLEILEKFQIRANIVAPLIEGESLWGLLCVHQCSGSREWTEMEVEFISQISEQLGVALQQGAYLDRVRSQAAQLSEAIEQKRAAERHSALARTVDRIRQSLDIQDIFDTTTYEVRELLDVERVAIYRFYPDWSGEFVADSIARDRIQLMASQPPVLDAFFQPSPADEYPRHEIFTPILQGEKLWGLLVAYQLSQPRNWQDFEVKLLAQVSVQLGLALQQAEYLQQLESQSVQLAKAAERERTISTTIDKVRQSLDLETIFRTATREVRQLIDAERVAVYRFFNDWSGEFVSESSVEGWRSLVDNQPIIADTFLQTTQGGRYAHNETFSVDDIYEVGHSECHVELLEQCDIRAYAIAPIFKGQKLWGLFAAYQSSGPRTWQPDEVDLLRQIAAQLGVALQQAGLLEQTQQQKEELAKAFLELQQSQTHLIQSEKMAGLGQLVAGVAHEINNPVNFIFGNLSHVREYSQDLLQLVSLYRQAFPQTPAAIHEYIEDIDLEFVVGDLPQILSSMELGVNRIRQLVLSLRTFSRLDNADMKPVDIHEGIESTLLILQHRIKAKSDRPAIQIVKEFGELPLVECYAAQMNQVFMNIICNAIDALENAGMSEPTIRIRTEELSSTSAERPNPQIRISIADNGPGIPPHLRERLFDPFFTTKDPGKGTGLGLSISYQIVVEKHGGELTCNSLEEGGTEFAIAIPVHPFGQPST